MNPFDKTLVIIDMQTLFLHNNPACKIIIPEILLLIQHAKQNGWPIIMLEFEGFYNTDHELTRELSDYKHTAIVKKTDADGGKEVVECIHDHPSWPLNLLVCGIFGNECVAATVCGAFDASNMVEIDVVGDAVFPTYESHCDLTEDGTNPEGFIYVDDILEGCLV